MSGSLWPLILLPQANVLEEQRAAVPFPTGTTPYSPGKIQGTSAGDNPWLWLGHEALMVLTGPDLGPPLTSSAHDPKSSI